MSQVRENWFAAAARGIFDYSAFSPNQGFLYADDFLYALNELGNESCTTGQVYTALSHAGADADTGAMDYRTFTSALGLRKLFHKGSLFERAGELGVGAHVVELQYPRKFCLGHRFVFADLIMALP